MKRDNWLRELSEFIVEANGKTWAADGAEVTPERPGYNRLFVARGNIGKSLLQ